MIRVIIESPYAGDVEGNLLYLRECLKDSIARGEAPIAMHGLYTPGVLDDRIAAERAKGIDAGDEWRHVADTWRHVADTIVFYVDRGMSPGMIEALEKWIDDDTDDYPEIEIRRLGSPWDVASRPAAAIAPTRKSRSRSR